MQHAGVDSCRENAQPEMKNEKFPFLHRIIWVYVDSLLDFNDYFCVDFYTVHKGSR